ncbi:MAG: LysR family transcriptional regulator [Verrucomicrobiota bacterium]|jgi:DNA-binding transcriptional LysR family regulator
MQIDTLKIYCDVVRLRSFSRGAEANGVQQVAASLTVQRLEKRLGVTLIDRSCRPWKPTREGQIFYDGCREVLERFHELEREVRGRVIAADTVVRVAAIHSANLPGMSRCVRRFNELHPRARVELEYIHPSRVYERVLNNEVDLGILSFPQERRELMVIPWRKEPMVLACHPKHPLARRRKIAVKQLAGEPFVGFDADLVIRKKIDGFLREHGVKVKVVLTSDNIEAVKRAVEEGAGVAILPLPTLERELRVNTLAAVPFTSENFVRPLGIVYRRGHRFYPNTRAFIELMQQGDISSLDKKKRSRLE